MTDKEHNEFLTVSQAIDLIGVLTDDNESASQLIDSLSEQHSVEAGKSSYSNNSYPYDDYKQHELSYISQNLGDIYKDENYKSGCSTQSYSQSYCSSSYKETTQEHCYNDTQSSSQKNAYIIEAYDDFIQKSPLISNHEDAYILEAYDDFMKKK